MIKGSDWKTTYIGRGLLQAATDGDVTLEQMLQFIEDNEGLLEMILELSKQLKEITSK